jgi:hypothetical protein
MQLWILSYFPLIWLYKNPRLGVISCIALIGLGVVIPAIVLYLHELPTVASGRLMDLTFLIIHGTEFPRMHFYSYNNMSSYFLGILVGYCFATDRKLPNFFVANLMSSVCWVFCVCGVIGPYYWTVILGNTISPIADAIYGGLFRIFYMGGFASGFYNMFFFASKFVGTPFETPSWLMMESGFFTPLGRLSFSVFISQLTPLVWDIGMTYEQIPANWGTMFFRFLSVLVLCWVFGYFFFLLFEAPFVSMAKVLLSKAEPKEPSKSISQLTSLEKEELRNLASLGKLKVG